nr:GUN4 domain-containing protein [Iningainema tapete]
MGKNYLEDIHPPISEPVSQQKSQPTPVSSPQYKSDKVAPFPQEEVNYAPLRDLLAAENWKEADQETMKIMLEIADREESGWLQKKDIQKFSDETLNTINKLWIHHSKGQFGFSVQAKIWLECKGEPGKFNYTTYEKKFCVCTNWCVNGNWLKRYDNFKFSLDANKGHLPSLSFPDINNQEISWKTWKETFEYLLPRLFTCL